MRTPTATAGADRCADLDAATPAQLLERVRSARAARDALDLEVVLLALEWADAHPDLSGAGRHEAALPPTEWVSQAQSDPADSEWHGVPELDWACFAPFAAANWMSTTAGRALIRDALVLRHRLPRVFARVVAGEVQVWRARRIAQAVLARPDDVTAHIDAQTAPRAQEVGPVVLDRIVEEAVLVLHAEERELEQYEALDARYARLDRDSINHTGIAELAVRGDWADVAAFDDALSDVAAALSRHGNGESLDVRRSIAVGILADPARALALLNDEPAPSPSRRIVLNVHLNLDHSARDHFTGDPVALDVDQRAWLTQTIRTWCGRDDVRLSLQPVVALPGCGDHGCRLDESGTHTATHYQPTATDRRTVELRDPHCVFPFCTRPARACDLDHTTPYDPEDPTGADTGGPTCPCNLAPLCRHHHRLKTHAGWRYTPLEPGLYLWSDPHGHQFLTHRDGTRDVTPPGRGSAGRAAGHASSATTATMTPTQPTVLTKIESRARSTPRS